MEQLECRFYGREEIADITGLDVHSHNFAAQVREKLTSWGYTHEYKPRQGVEITKVPETPLERMAELMQRELNIDRQVEPYLFSCFILAIHYIENFDSMPWAEKERVFQEYFGVNVTGRTMQNWRDKLVAAQYIYYFSFLPADDLWHTYTDENGKRIREHVDPNSELEKKYKIYCAERSQWLEWLEKNNCPPKEKWSIMIHALYKEYGCFYKCVRMELCGFPSPYREEIDSLIYEIFPDHASPPSPVFSSPSIKLHEVPACETSGTSEGARGELFPPHTEHNQKKDSPL